MRPRNQLFIGLVLVGLVAVTCSCKNTIEILNQPGTPAAGDGTPGPGNDPVDDPPVEPEPLDIQGTFSTYATELADTCGFDPPEPYAPVLIEGSGASVTVTVGDGAGSCQESTRTRDGDTVTLARTDILDLDGDFVQVDLNIVYDFTPDGFTGTVTQSFTDLGDVFTDLPCEVTLAVTGTRCDDCWTGCTSPQEASALLPGLRIEDRLRELALRP